VDRRETNSSRFTLTFPERVSTLIKKIIPLDDMTVYLKDGDVIVDILRETGPLTYELVGVSGNIVRRGHLYSGVNNLGKFPSGLYIINTRNDEGTIVSKKLLVTR
ncbi:MAG TPA: hypothetical protein VKY45_00190, partial [Marinilabiliaceae bacterium]|nr:hypothetical protein [Marinilabiliaceae bacterium]